jgi:RHS repeat-associated protein
MARALDSATGLYYVRNRWYDPQVGRFVSEDPIGLMGGINLYAYAAENPISFRDPFGLSPCPDGWQIKFFANGAACVNSDGIVLLAALTGGIGATITTRTILTGPSTTHGGGGGIHPGGGGGAGGPATSLVPPRPRVDRETVEESCSREAYRRAAYQSGRNGLLLGTATGAVGGAVIGGTAGAVTFGTLGTLVTPGVGTVIGAVGGGAKGALVFAPVGAVLLGAAGGITGMATGFVDQGINCLVARFQAR